MKKIAALLHLWLFPFIVDAAPHVAGYERFHANASSQVGGAMLYSELGCANCHGGSAVVIPRKGPSLENLSSRVDYNWVLKFLKDPESSRTGSTMPALFHGMPERDVEAVAAYLATIGKGLRFKPARHANPVAGRVLYHEKGCVACHAPAFDSPGAADRGPPISIAHPDLKAKTSLVALEHFLANTSRYRTDGRMPHFELGRDGAINVAAYLLDIQGSDPRAAQPLAPWPKADGEQLKRGKVLVKKASCAACHDLPGIEPPKHIALAAKPSTAGGHCLSATPRDGLPRYALTNAQRDALLAFLAGPRSESDLDGTLTLQAMNCYACHDRNGMGGPTPETDPFFHGEESLGDSGRLPPPLTGVGHKLLRDWLAGVLAGDADKRVRPYLRTAMPSYPSHAAALADWLADVDAKPNATPLADVSGTLEDGRKLLGTQGGVNCIICHHWGEQRSLGIPGLDISTLDQRLRPEWFRSYLLNPASYRPGTLMPPLWPAGKSTIPDVLEGDAEQQISAVWDFIARGKGHPAGFPDRSGGQFELTPVKRPILQRTFLSGAGTKAILIGFPGNIHLAYDGNTARPALVWRGDFFNAYNTWFTRMAPFEKPLSDEVYAFAPAEGNRRFRGYELDKEGMPTFLFTESGRLVRERFTVRDGTLQRNLSWEKGNVPKVAHPKGVEVEETQTGKNLKVTYRWK